MRIAFDATPCEHASGGVGSYTKELFTELARISPGNEFIGVHAQKIEDFDIQNNLRLVRTGRAAIKIPDHSFWTFWNLPRALRRERADLFHATYLAFAPGRIPQVMTVHDMGLFDVHSMYPLRWQWYWGARMREGINSSQRIIAVSEWTKKRLLSYFPAVEEKVRVVYPGVAESFAQVNEQDVQCIRGIIGVDEKPFVLAVGTNQPRKNFVRLVSAFRNVQHHLPADTQLVFAGSSGWLEDLEKIIAEKKLKGVVKHVGFVSNEALRALYGAATLVATVPLYEGFGSPLVEAMKAGANVVASDIPPHREIVGESESVKFVSPTSEEEIGEGLVEVFNSTTSNKAARLRANEFTWKRTAEETMNVYRELS